MTTISDIFVSVIAPLEDDADILEAFVEDVLAILRMHYSNYELLLIDDGSQDETCARTKALLQRHKCVRYIRLSRRFGVEVAITAGLDSVIGDYVVVLNLESDPPALIPAMVTCARRRGGVVFAIPSDRPGEPLWSRIGRWCFHILGGRILGIEIPRNASQFMLLSRDAVNAVTRMRDKNRHLRLLSLDVGYATEMYPYEPIRRRLQPRTRGFSESVRLAVALAVSNSIRPLRLLSVLGLLASTLNLVYIGYALVVYFLKSDVTEGWTTLSLQMSAMFFLLFIILAVLSEYVGRILDESRDRPLYHVIEECNSNVLVADAERRNVISESA